MSETIDQTEVSNVAEPTPLNEILGGGAADVPASSPESDFGAGDIIDGRTVPLNALKKERERRKRMDARVRELEEEISRYNDQKWGVDEAWEAEQAADGANDDPQHSAWLKSYNKNLADFTTKHGKDRVAAIDAALPRLTPEQKNDVARIAGTSQNPIEDIQAYIEQAGMLDPAFKPLSLRDVLAGKQQPKPGENQANARTAALDQREQAIAAAERRTVYNASKTEFVSEHGKGKLLELDAVLVDFMQSGHPAAQQVAHIIGAHPDPVGIAAEMMAQAGLWSPAPAQQEQPRPVFPSNFANVRNVGVRGGPMWSGPTPLKDIFNRSRPAAQ